MSTTPNAYHGSCHCGTVQYQIKLTFPPVMGFEATSIRLYKCNCTTCHKMGFFHCRPIAPSTDFIVTSPATIEELGEYRTNKKSTGFYFCKNCGVRTFAVGGAWEQIEIEVDTWAGRKKEDEGVEAKVEKVWRTNEVEVVRDGPDGQKVSKKVHYVSVNAVTLDGGEDGVDLREWHDNGWLFYVQCREGKSASAELPPIGMKPFECGMY